MTNLIMPLSIFPGFIAVHYAAFLLFCMLIVMVLCEVDIIKKKEK